MARLAFTLNSAALSGGFLGRPTAPRQVRSGASAAPSRCAQRRPSQAVSAVRMQAPGSQSPPTTPETLGQVLRDAVRENVECGRVDGAQYWTRLQAALATSVRHRSRSSALAGALASAMIVLAAVTLSGSAGSLQLSPVASADAAPATTTAAPTSRPTQSAATNDNTSEVPSGGHLRYSKLLDLVHRDRIEKATFSPDMQRLLVVDVDGNRYRLDALPPDPDLLSDLAAHKVDVTVLPAQQDGNAGDLLRSLLVPLLLFGGLFLLSRRIGGGFGAGGMNNPLDMGRSQAKVLMVPKTGITFDDVAGVEGAKLELQEVVSFLKNSDEFTEVGAQVPRGVILEGPPGTGKTLLARAVAGEAGVPFFSISGSEFVEMFVGVGAARVRDLFAQAKKNAPCIIFIDEIDAVGRQRGAGYAGGNDEREQTLNQLLTEMDGFEGNAGVIVIAATNRSDVLDQALLRPGRFDRRVTVDLPDVRGRLGILRVHARNKPLAPDVDLEVIARRTPGFSGASLQSLMNEAAIMAARRNATQISNEDVDGALDRVLLGPAKKDTIMSEYKKRLVAYHEAGHALIGALTPSYDQPIKVTILPRGGAGGVTFFAPDEQRSESGMYSRQFLEAQLSVALGGRVAEEIVYGTEEATTGASNDLQQVTNVARRMVTEFGMSDVLGPITVESSGMPFMGRELGSRGLPFSMETRKLVDAEVDRLVRGAYQRTRDLLTKNRPLLDKLADLLVEKETVTSTEIALLIAESDVQMAEYAVLP